MHEQPDVISIKTRESSLIAEIFHDQLHEWSIFIFQVLEWEHSLNLPQEIGFDVWLIMLSVNLLFLVP